MEGVPRKKKYHCFFRRAPKSSSKKDFYTFGEYWQINIKKARIRTLCNVKVLDVQGDPQKKKYHGFFCGAPTTFKN